MAYGIISRRNSVIRVQNTVEGIMDKVDILMSFPEAGVKLEFENGLNSGYRYVSFKNYLAFYRLRSDDIVYIDRVIYSGRDYMRILFPNKGEEVTG